MAAEWSERFETNITEIDTQHRKLFSLLANLETLYTENKGNLKGKASQIKSALSELEQYTLTHFLIEERVMEDNDYPDLENHKFLHDKFTNKIGEFKEQLLSNGILEDESRLDEYLSHLIKYLSTWLTNHIMIKDMDYKPYIRRVL